MIGKGGMTGPNAGSSAEPSFSPYLAARNSSDKPLTISPVFSYDTKDQTEQVKLPGSTLGPQQSTVLNLREFQEKGVIPPWVEMGNIDVQYKGEGGALIAELASIDQNGSFVSPVRLICDGAQASAMSYWRTDGDWHSSVTLENIASQANDMEITVSYPGGIYLLEKRMAAGATAMVSINELQQSQEPDREGRRIPKDATVGGVNIWSPDIRNGLVINAMLMNPVTKTCGQCYEPGYVTAYTVSDKQANSLTPLYSGFDSCTLNQSFSIWLNVHYSMGTQGGVTPNYSSSSNPSVAIAGQGLGYTYDVGTASITAIGSNFFTDPACSQPHSISSTASLTVVKVNIKQGSTVITGTTQNVIVGQKISLTADVQPASATIKNREWTIPEVRVANYVATYSNPTSATSGVVTALGTNPVSGSSVDFYWVDGSEGRQVQFSVKVNGKTFTAIAIFNVKQPSAEITINTGAVQITSAWPSGYGMWLGIPTQVGISFSANVTIPSGFTGNVEWVQIWNKFRRVHASNGGWYRSSGAGLDSQYPYSQGNQANDSPGLPFGTNTGVIIDESFQMSLLFQPTGLSVPTIWVPLKIINWGWTGNASFDSSSWVLNSSSNPSNPQAADTTTHPTWTQNALNIAYTLEP
jgi:hypothetical protein